MSPLRNVKMFYHKVHKEISQRAQSVVIQTFLFVTFVPNFVSFVVKKTFRRGLLFYNHVIFYNNVIPSGF